MPYDGEFASYKPLQRIAEAKRVRDLLTKARSIKPAQNSSGALIPFVPDTPLTILPGYAFAIDGSYAEVDIRNGFPAAKVGYITVASVLLNLRRIDELDEMRPTNPVEFRKTEEASTLDAAMPGCNVVTHSNTSAVESFREALYENFVDVKIEDADQFSLLDTYEYLLKQRSSESVTACPYRERADCCERFLIPKGTSSCKCPRSLPIYSTDALRIHERFREGGANGEPLGEVMQVWERVLLVHLLRWFEQKGLVAHLSKVVFILDGPLATFGHPAWLSPILKRELARINERLRTATGEDLLIIGVEKTGAFVDHFAERDTLADGSTFFPKNSVAILADSYVKERIIYSSSEKAYGQDTYFGRKLFVKTISGARVVATIPVVTAAQEDTSDTNPDNFPSLGRVCAVLNKLVSSRFPNSIGAVVSAHSHAAIPLTLGTKVLEQLAQSLMKA